MNSVLLFGGSFDPPTLAHVQIAQFAMHEMQAEHVLFMPAYQSPLKDKTRASARCRIAMLELVLQETAWASISRLEIERGGASYTIDTVEAFLQKGIKVQLLIGADQWLQFDQWHRHEDLLELAHPIVIPRDGINVPKKHLLSMTPIDCSSTIARLAIKNDEPLDNILHPRISAYITENGLYQ